MSELSKTYAASADKVSEPLIDSLTVVDSNWVEVKLTNPAGTTVTYEVARRPLHERMERAERRHARNSKTTARRLLTRG